MFSYRGDKDSANSKRIKRIHSIFHAKVMAFSFVGIKGVVTSLGITGVKADTLVHNAVTGVLAFTPKPTCRLITPFHEKMGGIE